MLCSTCSDVFTVQYRLVVQQDEVFPHQLTSQSLSASAHMGCEICSALCKITSPDLSTLWENEKLESFNTSYTNTRVRAIQDQGYLTGVPDNTDGFLMGRTGEWHLDEDNQNYISYRPSGNLFSIEFFVGLPETCFDNGVTFRLEAAQGNKRSEGDYKPPHSTAAEDCLLLAKRWIETCVKEHRTCSQGHSNFRPTRLLDLTSTGTSSEICLVSSSQMPSAGRYMTLSHCWGSGNILKLTTTNFQSMTEKIIITTLPKTFTDAIFLARYFGIRFLWIDSLCIVQDSLEDWQTEAALMGQVYKHSYCNIAAMGAANSQEGFFFERDTSIIRPIKVDVQWGDGAARPFVLTRKDLLSRLEVAKAPLSQRAWVLQEQLLAPRTLSFSKQQISWACCELDACETYPFGTPSDHGMLNNSEAKKLNRPFHVLKTSVLLDGRKDRNAIGPYDNPYDRSITPLYQRWLTWKSIVEDYSRRALTVPSDKLVALNAVAQVMRSNMQCEYLAGIMYQQIKFSSEMTGWELLWTVGAQSNGQPSIRPEKYRAPSWSWASVDGQISFFCRPDAKPIVELGYLYYRWIDTAPGNRTGQVRGGWIDLSGPLAAREVLLRLPAPIVHWDDLKSRKEQEDVDLAILGEDITIPKITVHYLALVTARLEPATWGLVLFRNEKGEYRRGGMFEAQDWETMDALKEAKKASVRVW